MEDPLPSTSKVINSGGDEDSFETEPEQDELLSEKKPLNMSAGAVKLRSWLNKTLRIEMSDGRILIGAFLCTDRDANIILGTCSEYLPEESELSDEIFPSTNNTLEEPRMLGLVMVPGKHIVSICIDQNEMSDCSMNQPLSSNIRDEDVM